MTPEQTRDFFIECLQDQVKILQKKNAELEAEVKRLKADLDFERDRV